MGKPGHVKLHRKSLESAVFESEPMWRLWTYLLMSANWASRQLPDGTTLAPGEMVLGYRRICEDLKWGTSKTVRWMRRLEVLGNIKTHPRSGTLAQVISICNWSDYQSDQNATGNATGNEKEKSKKSKNSKAPVSFPEKLDNDAFRAAWTCWTNHRTEIRKPLKLTQTEAMLKKLATWGPDRAIAAINYTIEKGWQGLREPDEQPDANQFKPLNFAN